MIYGHFEKVKFQIPTNRFPTKMVGNLRREDVNDGKNVI